MNTISVSLSTLQSFVPTTINGIAVDGIVDGRPVTIRRNRYNGLVPSVGSVINTTYGTAEVVGHSDGMLKVAVIEFDEDYEFVTADETDILTAEECVERLARCANASIESVASDLRRIYQTDVGNVPTKIQDTIDSLDVYDDNEYRMCLTDKAQLSDDVEVLCDYVHTYLLERETPIERAERIRKEREQAKALADELLGDDGSLENIPADVLAEMAMEFGEF